MKIAILTPFGEFASAYSLVHVVCDQARALLALQEEVEIWALTSLPEAPTAPMNGLDCIRRQFRPHIFKPDDPQPEAVAQVSEDIRAGIERFGPDIIITHDMVFQSHYIAFAKAIHQIAGEFPDQFWFHYAHSVMFHPEPINDGNRWRRRIPDGHYVIYPNPLLKAEVGSYYDIPCSRVHTVANVKDPRTQCQPMTQRIVTDLRLMERDVVQILPFCATRMHGKGVAHTAKLFEKLKDRGLNVCLVCCNANANGEREQRAIADFRACFPDLGEDLVFTSQMDDQWQLGLPNEVVNELFRFSNVFAFFSMGEACSLILAEAQANGCLCVLNQNVPAMQCFAAPGTLWQMFDSYFGKCQYRTEVKRDVKNHLTGAVTQAIDVLEGAAAYNRLMEQLAELLHQQLNGSISHINKRHAFRTYSYEAHGLRLMEIFATAAGVFDGNGVSSVG